MKLFGKILFWLGVLSLILGIIGAVLGATSVGKVNDAVNDKSSIDGSTSIAMEDGETRMLFGPSSGGADQCTAEGATIEGAPAGTSGEVNGEEILGIVTASGDGDVTITCEGQGYGLSGPASMGDFLKLGLGFLAAALLIPLGLLLMLIGGLLWFFGRKKDRERRTSYTNGEYSDQFSRSAPYSQRGGQAPPAPGQYDDRGNAMGYGAAGAAGAGAAGAGYGVMHDDGERRDGRPLDGDRPQYGERVQDGDTYGQPVREDRPFGEPLRDDRGTTQDRPFRNDGDFGRPLDGEPVRDDRGGSAPMGGASPAGGTPAAGAPGEQAFDADGRALVDRDGNPVQYRPADEGVGQQGERLDDRGDRPFGEPLRDDRDDRGDRPFGGGSTPPPPPRGH
ncbi:hypothetical protein [Kytococcus sedentarius]|uniref:hypothetical protein n=1 Tax=Kytococcus sedentarius TaxID=1276 RepID=UPI0035BC39D6